MIGIRRKEKKNLKLLLCASKIHVEMHKGKEIKNTIIVFTESDNPPIRNIVKKESSLIDS